MKNLLRAAAVLGVIIVIVVVVALLNPKNAVVAMSESSGAQFTELFVVKRNHTYEQLFQRKNDGAIFKNSGSWSYTADDPNSQLFAAQTGTSVKGYVTYKDKIEANNKTKEFHKIAMAMEPVSMKGDPTTALLEKWQQWNAKAQPITDADLKPLRR